MKIQYWKSRDNNRVTLVDISRDPKGHEIASAPTTKEGLAFLREIEKAYRESKHVTRT